MKSTCGSSIPEYAHLADVLEVLEGDHEGRGAEDFVLAFGGEVGERHREQRAPDAVTHRVYSLAAGDLTYHVRGFQETQVHVVLELGFFHRGVGILPTHDEDGEALLYEVVDHAVLWAHVEDIVLVDPGRDYEHRDFVDLLGLGLVLDQLYKFVAMNYFTGGYREVLSGLEGRVVGHAELALFEVFGQVAGAIGQALAASLHRAAQGFGVGDEEVHRGHRVHELLEVELELLFLFGVVAVCFFCFFEQVFGGEQVHLFQGLVVGVLVPLPGAEAVVALAGLDLLFLLGGGEAPRPGDSGAPGFHSRGHETGVVFGGYLHSALGVGHLAHPEGLERTGDLRPIYRQHVL